MSRIYVGNLSYDANETELRDLFAEHGSVKNVNIITDRETGRPRGFAFVEMSSNDEAQGAIQSLDGQPFAGRNLRVNEAQPRPGRTGGEQRRQW